MDPELDSRLPPQDLAAEKALLGSILRNNPTFLEVQGTVRSDDFYSFANCRVFDVVAEMIIAGKPVDPVTLLDVLHERQMKEDVGGAAYIVDLWDSAPAADNAKHYAEIVRKKSVLRQLINLCTEVRGEAFESHGGTTVDQIVSKLEQGVFRLAVGRQKVKPQKLATVIDETLALLDKRKQVREGKAVGDSVPSGWGKLDAVITGFFNSELTILAARPSTGKTMVAMQIADAVASEGKKVLVASVEQRRTELVERMLSRRSGVTSYAFRRAEFTDEQEARVFQAVDDLRKLGIVIDDPAEQDVMHIASTARMMKIHGGLDLLIVDYLQIITPMDMRGTRNDQVAGISRGLKSIARNLDIPVIALAQLKRPDESRGSRNDRPRLTDLRESGNIEQDADTVILLHKPEEFPDVEPIEFLIRKQRNGPPGKVTLEHHKRTFDIRETTKREEP